MKSVGDLTSGHRRAGELMFQKTGSVGRYPGLDKVVIEHFKKALGGDADVDLTPELRNAAVMAANSLSIAFDRNAQ